MSSGSAGASRASVEAAARAADAEASVLSPAEAATVAAAAAQEAAETAAYLSAHPELARLVADFTAAALAAKPDDPLGFAKNYFEAVANK